MVVGTCYNNLATDWWTFVFCRRFSYLSIYIFIVLDGLKRKITSLPNDFGSVFGNLTCFLVLGEQHFIIPGTWITIYWDSNISGGKTYSPGLDEICPSTGLGEYANIVRADFLPGALATSSDKAIIQTSNYS